MIKSQLRARITAAKPYLNGRLAEKILDAIFDEIANTLSRGDRVEIKGFGVLFVKARKARIARNPLTGALVSVKEKKALGFKVGKEMRGRLNKRI